MFRFLWLVLKEKKTFFLAHSFLFLSIKMKSNLNNKIFFNLQNIKKRAKIRPLYVYLKKTSFKYFQTLK